MIRFLFFCVIVFLNSCSSQRNKSDAILESHEMTEVFRDILLAESYVESYLSKDTTLNKDTLLRREMDLVLALHKIDAKTFSKNYKYYKDHPDLFKLVMDSASSRLSKEKDKGHGNFNKLVP